MSDGYTVIINYRCDVCGFNHKTETSARNCAVMCNHEFNKVKLAFYDRWRERRVKLNGKCQSCHVTVSVSWPDGPDDKGTKRTQTVACPMCKANVQINSEVTKK